MESIATPPASTGLDSSGFNDSRLGFFVYSFPGNLQNNRDSNDFICDQDPGWCRQYMSHLANDITAFNPFPAHLEATPTRTNITTEVSDPLQAFFALYAPFEYNRLASSHDEFKRLYAFSGWPPHYVEPNHEERREAWKSFRIAMVKTFNMTFGQDECDVEA